MNALLYKKLFAGQKLARMFTWGEDDLLHIEKEAPLNKEIFSSYPRKNPRLRLTVKKFIVLNIKHLTEVGIIFYTFIYFEGMEEALYTLIIRLCYFI